GPICSREEEEDLMQELNRELKAKNEQIHALKARDSDHGTRGVQEKKGIRHSRRSLRIITNEEGRGYVIRN
ncbi:hypothetical protein Dimus_016210, partial [Dionaea muscipula]